MGSDEKEENLVVVTETVGSYIVSRKMSPLCACLSLTIVSIEKKLFNEMFEYFIFIHLIEFVNFFSDPDNATVSLLLATLTVSFLSC